MIKHSLVPMVALLITVLTDLAVCSSDANDIESGLGVDMVTASNPSAIVSVKIGNPVIVAQAPPELDRGMAAWGRWQFPFLNRLTDGRLHVSFSIEPDSYDAHGAPMGHAYSSDNGRTWQLGTPKVRHEVEQGIVLPNGDRIETVQLPPKRAEMFNLPVPVCTFICNYGYPRSLYAAADLPDQLTEWRFNRLPAGHTQWKQETPQMHVPDDLRCVIQEEARHQKQNETLEPLTQGAFLMPSLRGKIRLAPDGSLWAVTYDWRMCDDTPRYLPIFLRSVDQGHTWKQHCHIKYQPDEATDPLAQKRDGFTEPDYCFMPDGSIICIMRTMDGNGHGPLYLTRSQDQGRTWSKPAVFGSFGKMPQLLTLENGVTLATYGASGGPGYFVVRATVDPAGMDWQPPITFPVTPPQPGAGDTCGHTEMVPINDHSALIVYSDFNFPDNDDIKRKTILTRLIETTLVTQ